MHLLPLKYEPEGHVFEVGVQPFVVFQLWPDGHFVDNGMHWPLN